MKKRLFVATVVLFMVGLFCGNTQAFAGWHEWSQGTRNQAIVDESYQYLDTYVGESWQGQ